MTFLIMCFNIFLIFHHPSHHACHQNLHLFHCLPFSSLTSLSFLLLSNFGLRRRLEREKEIDNNFSAHIIFFSLCCPSLVLFSLLGTTEGGGGIPRESVHPVMLMCPPHTLRFECKSILNLAFEHIKIILSFFVYSKTALGRSLGSHLLERISSSFSSAWTGTLLPFREEEQEEVCPDG